MTIDSVVNKRDSPSVWIERTPHAAFLQLPEKDDVPWSASIESVLNTALLTKFGSRYKFEPSFACEGGLEGNKLTLTNIGWDHIGLVVEEYFDNPQYYAQLAKPVLDFYERLLRLIFEEKFSDRYGKGEIIWLQLGQETAQRARGILFDALSHAHNRRFASHVFKKLEELRKDPFSRYLIPMTDEYVERIFVPPLITKIT